MRRDALLRAFAGAASGLGIFGSALLAALDWAVHPATHLVIVEGGEPDSAARAETMHKSSMWTKDGHNTVNIIRIVAKDMYSVHHFRAEEDEIKEMKLDYDKKTTD